MRNTRRELRVICDAVKRLFGLPSFTIYLFWENFPYYDAKNENKQVCFSEVVTCTASLLLYYIWFY